MTMALSRSSCPRRSGKHTATAERLVVVVVGSPATKVYRRRCHSPPWILLALLLLVVNMMATIVSCFVVHHPLDTGALSSPRRRSREASTTCGLAAAAATAGAKLTDRQLQFWEDVDDGLDDIEAFYEKQGQSIDRIRQFAKSARGDIPPPTGYAVGHEPSEEHVEGLTAKPFWDDYLDAFPWTRELENQSHLILQELESKIITGTSSGSNNNNDPSIFAGDSAWQNQVMGGGWSAIRLQRLGVWNADTCREFPETYSLLKSLQIPLAVRGVCFARQAPRSGVQPHSDGRNFILTAHLGLKIPQGCWIQVGSDDDERDSSNRREWNVGKLLVVDTSFRHSTGNPSDHDRHVLIVDFWHPELTLAERSALEFVYDLRNKYESGKVPVRPPRRRRQQGQENGLGGWWQALTGGGGEN